MRSDMENTPAPQAEPSETTTSHPAPAGLDWARAQAAVRQAIPHLKELALYTALLGPIIVDRMQTASISSGHGW